jgi:NDP-sugar pyrophosphorylase family protein
MSSVTHALLLTAGLGTRLRPLSSVRAKPAIPVAGVPMVQRIIGWLTASGVRNVVLNLHHLPETITGIVGDGSQLGVTARYSWEQPMVLGSAGGPRQALDIIGAETFLLVNGDTLTDLPIEPLVASHRQHDAAVTMAVIPNPNPQHYSGLRVDDRGVVVGVVPRGSGPSFHFIGVQVARRDAFAGVPAGQFASSVGEVYDRLIATRDGSVRAHVCDARFWDIGTVADYWRTSHEFAADAAQLVQAGTTIAPGATLTDCITWDGVAIGARSRLSRCILTDGVTVEPDSVYDNQILLRGTTGETVAQPFEAHLHD